MSVISGTSQLNVDRVSKYCSAGYRNYTCRHQKDTHAILNTVNEAIRPSLNAVQTFGQCPLHVRPVFICNSAVRERAGLVLVLQAFIHLGNLHRHWYVR